MPNEGKDESLLNKIPSDAIVYRTIGGEVSRERLGLGCFSKAGWVVDELNFAPKDYSLVYVVRGSGRYLDANGNEYPLAAGSIFQRLPGVSHTTYVDPDSDWLECFLSFGKHTYDALSTMRIIRSENSVYQINQSNEIVERTIQLRGKLNVCTEPELPDVTVEIISFLVWILKKCHFFDGETRKLSSMIEESCEYFRRNTHKRVNIKDYCKQHHWGYELFRKTFRQEIGMSPGKYSIRCRLDSACKMLSNQDLSIEEIAYKLGYSSQFEFSSQFKRYMGMAPKFFRCKS